MTPRFLSRRKFLRLAAAGTGAAALAACGGSTPDPTATVAPTATRPPSATPAPSATATIPTTPTATSTPLRQVEIITSGWPVDVFSEEEAALDPARRAQQEALRAWLDRHPGVTFTKVPVDVFDPAAVQAAVRDGTAPTYLYGPALTTGSGHAAARRAFEQGLVADVTGLVEQQRLPERILPRLWANWSAHSSADGRFFAYPLNEYAPANGIWVYNKALLNQKGICLPEIGWSWDEAEKIMKAATDESQLRYGLAAPYAYLADFLAQHGANILTERPAPDMPWHWQRDWSDPRWGELAARYRRMIFRDKTIYSDPSVANEFAMLSLFKVGHSVFAPVDYWEVFGPPSDPESLPSLADQRGLAFGDAFGVVTVPAGDGYHAAAGDVLWGPVSFNPNHTAEQTALAVDLIEWMYFGEGLDISRLSLWNSTRDPRAVFRSFLYLDGRDRYKGVPARAKDAWGEEMVAAWKQFGERPVAPRKEEFFPTEIGPGPSNQPFDDLFLRIVSVGDNINSEAKLKQAAAAWNQSAQESASNMTAEEFLAAALRYYAALAEYLSAAMPAFYQNRFLPVYQGQILPRLGG